MPSSRLAWLGRAPQGHAAQAPNLVDQLERLLQLRQLFWQQHKTRLGRRAAGSRQQRLRMALHQAQKVRLAGTARARHQPVQAGCRMVQAIFNVLEEGGQQLAPPGGQLEQQVVGHLAGVEPAQAGAPSRVHAMPLCARHQFRNRFIENR